MAPPAADDVPLPQFDVLASGAGGSGGAVITRGETTLGLVLTDAEQGLTVFVGVDIQAFCTTGDDFDVVSFRDIESPSEEGRVLRQLKGEDLRASAWPLNNWNCGMVTRIQPLATGTVDLIRNDNDLTFSRGKGNAWGFNFHGSLDGRSVSGHRHCVANAKKASCKSEVQLQGHQVAVRNRATGNYYQGISVASTFEDARAMAESMTFRGCTGHLATVTSQEENDFIRANLPWATELGYWLGGVQPAGSSEPAGGWEWITGEAWNYTNWANGEPNNFGDEGALHFFGPFVNPGAPDPDKWNDTNVNVAWGSLVEYECGG